MRKLDQKEALMQFVTCTVQSHLPEEHLVIIRDKSIITQVLRKYKNPRFNLQSPLNIQFQSSGTVELGVDAGASPSRAFYYLMQELLRRRISVALNCLKERLVTLYHPVTTTWYPGPSLSLLAR